MLNVQHFEKELIEIRRRSDSFGLKNGVPYACNAMECPECDLNFSACEEEAIKWLNSEYEKQNFNWNFDINWRSVPVDTEVLVRDSAVQRWREERFCVFLPERGADYPFITFDKNKTRENATVLTKWRYCKLLNKKDVERYMYPDHNVENRRGEEDAER